MASFASIVKKELTQLEVHPEHAKAELSALIRMNGSLTLMAHRFVLNIQTENPAIALVFARRLFGKRLGEQSGNIALSSGNLLIICRSQRRYFKNDESFSSECADR